MNRLTGNQITEFLTEHPFSTTQQIKSTGIIKNHTFLKKHINSLEKQKKIKHLEFFNRYYVNSLPEQFVMLGRIYECAEKISLQLKKNQNLRQGSFYREFNRAYKKYDIYTGTKVSKAKRVVEDLSEKTDNIKKSNERCLLKWFLLYQQKAIIWELEFRKLKQSPFATVDDQKLIHSMYVPMWFFEDFLKNYDPKNSKYILDISYETLEKSLDQMYSDDLLYFKSIKSNKVSFSKKILCYTDYLLNDCKKDASEFCHIMKKLSVSYKKHIKKKLDKISDNEIEERFQPINKKLTSNMYPKNNKSISHMINSLHNKKGMLDVKKLLHEQRMEQNRLLCDSVDEATLDRFMLLYVIRFNVKQITRDDPAYKKMKKKMEKKHPEFVMA